MTLRADWLPALAAFECAARHQNFARAADELHLTASAVSHHVRRLEDRLGVALFQRHARGVSLTPQGRALADSASTALTDLETVVGSLRAPHDERDRLRIATLHSLLYTWLMPRLARFSTANPRVRLTLETGIEPSRFDENGPDIAIRHGAGHWPGLTSHHLMDDALFPVASPKLPGLSRITKPAQIAQLPLIHDLARQGWADWFRGAGAKGVKFTERHSFVDTTDALQAAVHGMGAALARTQIAEPYLASGQLVRLPGPEISSRWNYYVIYPSHRPLRPVAQRFVDWLLHDTRGERARSSAARIARE
jgi:LysR family glycine cleavage system transcriptional activator